MRRIVRTYIALSVLLTGGACITHTAVAQTITDGFEGTSISSFWGLQFGPGTAALTSAVAHTGTQSVLFEASSVYPNWVGLRHDFESLQFGSVSVWAKTGPFGLNAALGIYYNRDVPPDQQTPIAILQRTLDNRFRARFWPADGSPEIDTDCDAWEAGGWNKLEIEASADGLVMKVDCASCFKGLAVKLARVGLDLWGGSSGSEYFDDFTATTTPPAPVYGVYLLCDAAKPAKSGSTIPVKLQLRDSSGRNLSAPGLILRAVGVTQIASALPAPAADSGRERTT